MNFEDLRVYTKVYTIKAGYETSAFMIKKVKIETVWALYDQKEEGESCSIPIDFTTTKPNHVFEIVPGRIEQVWNSKL